MSIFTYSRLMLPGTSSSCSRATRKLLFGSICLNRLFTMRFSYCVSNVHGTSKWVHPDTSDAISVASQWPSWAASGAASLLGFCGEPQGTRVANAKSSGSCEAMRACGNPRIKPDPYLDTRTAPPSAAAARGLLRAVGVPVRRSHAQMVALEVRGNIAHESNELQPIAASRALGCCATSARALAYFSSLGALNCKCFSSSSGAMTSKGLRLLHEHRYRLLQHLSGRGRCRRCMALLKTPNTVVRSASALRARRPLGLADESGYASLRLPLVLLMDPTDRCHLAGLNATRHPTGLRRIPAMEGGLSSRGPARAGLASGDLRRGWAHKRDARGLPSRSTALRHPADLKTWQGCLKPQLELEFKGLGQAAVHPPRALLPSLLPSRNKSNTKIRALHTVASAGSGCTEAKADCSSRSLLGEGAWGVHKGSGYAPRAAPNATRSSSVAPPPSAAAPAALASSTVHSELTSSEIPSGLLGSTALPRFCVSGCTYSGQAEVGRVCLETPSQKALRDKSGNHPCVDRQPPRRAYGCHVQMLGKSFKMMPVMLWSIVISGKKYEAKDWLIAGGVTWGVTQFLMTGSIKSKHADKGSSVYGLILMGGFLGCDGFTSTFQEKVFKDCKTTKYNQMLYVNAGSAVVSLSSFVLSGAAPSTIAFCFRHVDFVVQAMCLSAAAVGGQFFIYSQVKEFGALVLAATMNLRQVISIMVSYLLYGHSITLMQVLGLVMVFGALFYKTYLGYKDGKDKPKATSKPAKVEAVEAQDEDPPTFSRAGWQNPSRFPSV
ncbi:unnamed protein product [Prorocentrum cordatum]|uniref:Solute carrier family 35 member B1 n=1 Tax=Prorocentrum cordatum TaxID=2364126 RepID=A0ABN9SXL8_9DINO|nr:unnamed protein product [Polarella glacialis]